MDHGVWPLTSTRLYIDQTGDLACLLRPQAYFKDSHTHRCQVIDHAWTPEGGTAQRTTAGEVYTGSLLEHLLVQHLTAFFNVGEHNAIRLEGADWNDGNDMARQRGESVAFSAYYASNLRLLGEMVLDLEKLGIGQVELLSELLPLLDSTYNPVDYECVTAKQERLALYFESVSGTISGQKIRIPPVDLAADLLAKADWMVEHLRSSEWIQSASGYAWFNGYYDNDGQRLEGDFASGVRMTLAGQVFALMGGIASDEQARQIVRAADHFLLDPKVGGHRLNTDFGEVLLNMGRCFGFAYGHKENGSMFSHMAVMYAYALYERGLGREGFAVLNRIYRQSCDFNTSRIYPGIPEYFNPRGRGMYPYLTGSASWYLLTLTTRAFGVRGKGGDLLLAPMLVAEQFDTCGEAALKIRFAGRQLEVSYHNPDRLDYGAYRIRSVRLDGETLPMAPAAQVILLRPALLALDDSRPHVIEVDLG
jgi:cellobiose phosphorylase